MRTLVTCCVLLLSQIAQAADDRAFIKLPAENGTFAVEIIKSDKGYQLKVVENSAGLDADLLTEGTEVEEDSPGLTAELISADVGPDRVVVIMSETCPPCVVAKPKMYAAFGDLSKVTEPRQWRFGSAMTDDFQVLDAERDKALVDVIANMQGGELELPAFFKIENGAIVREFKVGCTTPLDQWSLGWLYHGVNNRPALTPDETATVPTSGHYPLRGGWWSVNGNWRPSKSYLVSHLADASQHRGKFDRVWLNSLTSAELNSVHSDDHERRLKSQYVNKFDTTVPPQVAKPAAKKAPAVRRAAPTRRGTYCPTCPYGSRS